MLSFVSGLARPMAATRFMGAATPLAFLVRTMKTHKGAIKRWKKLSSGSFKRRQAGRRHGNVGWSRSKVLGPLNKSVEAKNTSAFKKLRELMPY